MRLMRRRHGTWSGVANQQDGVTIDLSDLKEVTISKDNNTVQIGPGNRWADVYGKLVGHGLGTSGGRWGNVGVGGLLTGGESWRTTFTPT
jgi:FAD/FMN-containing dehydrogenase